MNLPCITTLLKLSYFNCTIPLAVANISFNTLVSSSIANRVKLSPVPLRPSKFNGLFSKIERDKDNLGQQCVEEKEEEKEEEWGEGVGAKEGKKRKGKYEKKESVIQGGRKKW